MTFGTPTEQLKKLIPSVHTEKPDGKNKFPLTEEELAYVRSIDNQLHAAKESMEAVVAAAQHAFSKSLTQIGIMKDDFMRKLADKHKVKLTRQSTVAPLSGLFIVSEEEDKEEVKPIFPAPSGGGQGHSASQDNLISKLNEVAQNNPGAIPADVAETLKIFSDAENGQASEEALFKIGKEGATGVITNFNLTPSQCYDFLEYVLGLTDVTPNFGKGNPTGEDIFGPIRACVRALESEGEDLEGMIQYFAMRDIAGFEYEVRRVLDGSKYRHKDKHKANAVGIMQGMLITYFSHAVSAA